MQRTKTIWNKFHLQIKPNNIRNVARATRENVILGPVGLKRVGRDATTELDHFLLFITNDMISNIVRYTNNKINVLISKLADDFNKDYKYTFVRETDNQEMRAFIGLFLYRGVVQIEYNGHYEIIL